MPLSTIGLCAKLQEKARERSTRQAECGLLVATENFAINEPAKKEFSAAIESDQKTNDRAGESLKS